MLARTDTLSASQHLQYLHQKRSLDTQYSVIVAQQAAGMGDARPRRALRLRLLAGIVRMDVWSMARHRVLDLDL